MTEPATRPASDPEPPSCSPPEPAWFQWVADNAGLAFFVLRVHPDVSFEFLNGGTYTSPGGRGPDHSPAGAAALLAHIHPDSADSLNALLRLDPGQSTPVELRWRPASGETVHSRGWAHSRRREDGSVVIEGALQDISELKKMEADLRRSEERHRLLVENAWDVIWTMGLDGSINYVSPAVQRIRGITPAEAMSQTLDQIHPPSSAASVTAYYERLFTAIAEGIEPPEFHGEHEYFRSDGSIMTGELQVIPHVTSDGTVVEILGVTRDITERKQVEAAQALYHRLIDSSFVATNLTAPDGRFTLVNQAMCNLVGYDKETLLTMSWQQLTAPDDLADNADAIAELIAGNRDSYRTRKRYIRADGRIIWCDESVGCIRRGGREAEHLVAQIIDITDELEAQDRLARQEKRNRALAERLRAELDSAARYVASILPGELAGPVHVTSRYLPSLEIGGDSFNYTWIDDDYLIIYVIDVSGHGVEPALVSMSVHNLLRSGSLPRSTLLAPDRVLAELNKLFEMEKHGGNYFTIWYGTYQASTRTLRYASGGHPPAIAMIGTAVKLLTAQATPLGMFSDTEFTTTVYPIPPDCRLLLYSDGAFEFTLPGGTMHTLGDFLELCTAIAENQDWTLDSLIETLQQRTETGAFDDDCALIRLQFD